MTSTIPLLSDPARNCAYREAGDRQRDTVVLIHGVGMQSAAWSPQIAALSRDFHIVALDMPGHGGSSPLASEARLPDFVDWLRASLDSLGLDRVNVAGHSMGALIAGGFAVAYPDRTERVALLNGVFRRSEEAAQSVRARAAQIGTGEFDLETPLTRWFGDSAIEQAARRDVAGWLSAVDIDGYATAYRAFAEGDAHYADGYAAIACPFLALTGADDPNSTPDMAQDMANIVQNGRAKVIENHRHMVNLTAPDAVNEALKTWLDTPLKKADAA